MFFRRYFLCLYLGLCVLCFNGLALAQAASVPETDRSPEEISAAQSEAQEVSGITKEEFESRQQIVKSLISMSETLEVRQKRLSELGQELEKTKDETERPALQDEIDLLTQEVAQADDEIKIVVLGLQSREYDDIGNEETESEEFDLGTEISKIFQPLVTSLERATEPSRRMEELRQLSSRTHRKEKVAQATLDHIRQFRQDGADFKEDVDERLKDYEAIWQTRLDEAINLGNALDEQLEAANRARGNTFANFAEDIGQFIINRGASLLLALGMGIGFLVICQAARVGLTGFFRSRKSGILSAPIRITGMILSAIGVIGALMIAITIFNIRHDWLMLAMSLLLALALSWSFVRALPTFIEEGRVLLNLGSVREGERTIVNGLPYRIERLSLYSKLVNPALNGGSLTFPVRHMLDMHSRPVTEGESWFPTEIGDWILRDGSFFEVVNQTPEHVIIRRPSGAEDFVPIAEFLGTKFEVISNGYCRTHIVGLSYNHLTQAISDIPAKLSTTVRKHVLARVGEDALESVDTRLVELGGSSLDYMVMVTVGSGQGRYWGALKTDISNATIEACLEHDWEIPFPQIVVHNADV